MPMETKRLGKTDLEVGRLGIGLSEVGFNLEMADANQVREATPLHATASAKSYLATSLQKDETSTFWRQRQDISCLAAKAKTGLMI